jgi:hypothetical protein
MWDSVAPTKRETKKQKNTMKKHLLIVLITALFCGCQNRQIEQTEEPFVLPEGAIPVVYRSHIYIQAEINDSVEGNFAFDTGADDLYFDSIFYSNSQFSVSKLQNAFIGGIGNSLQQILVSTDTFDVRFGNYHSQSVFTPIIQLKSVVGDFADGIIGQQSFSKKKYLMEINYVHEYLMLHNDTSTIDFSDYTKIKMEKQRNRFFVPITIQINDTLSIQENFTLDIGKGSAISIQTATAEKYKLPTQVKNKVRYYTNSGGLGGASSSVHFRANSVEIGGYKLDSIVMNYSEDKRGSMANSQFSGGLLGNGILNNFDIVIDFGDSPALYLKPNRNFNRPNVSARRSFAYTFRTQTLGGWIVSGFFENGSAEKSGLKLGDKIISVNGVDIRKIPFKEHHDFWKNLDKAELVVLRNSEEIKFEIELKDIQF